MLVPPAGGGMGETCIRRFVRAGFAPRYPDRIPSIEKWELFKIPIIIIAETGNPVIFV